MKRIISNNIIKEIKEEVTTSIIILILILIIIQSRKRKIILNILILNFNKGFIKISKNNFSKKLLYLVNKIIKLINIKTFLRLLIKK